MSLKGEKSNKKRLQVVLAHAGVASRREAEKIIKEGRVRVDGKVITEMGFRVEPGVQKITVDEMSLRKSEKRHYFIFNKPRGVTTTVKDFHARRTVIQYFDKISERLYPVGRLDKETSGLLLVTNDGELTRRLSHPSFKVDKEYVVSLSESVSMEAIERLRKGVFVAGKKTAPCIIEPLEKGISGKKYRIIIQEGKKRQIRRMFESAGTRVKKLDRVRYAFLKLGSLQRGRYRALEFNEVKRLKQVVGL